VLATGVLVAAGCGGGDDDSDKSTDKSTNTRQQPKNAIDQGVRAIGGDSASEFGPSAEAAPDDAVQLRISLPPGKDPQATTPTTVEITQKKNNLSIKTTAKGLPPATSTIVGTGGPIGVKDVLYNCQLPPNTFCPVQSKRVGSGAVLSFDAKRNVSMSLDIGKPGELPPAGQIKLTPPSPNSSVKAEVTVRTSGGDSEGPPTNTTEAGPDDHVSVNVRPEQDSPAEATLRIAFPKASGDEITVEAGGTEGKPSSTATIKSSGDPIKVDNIRYNCHLPPTTICPVDVKQTATGIELNLKAPTVPVTLQLSLAGA
jgi:hypothetical protein